MDTSRTVKKFAATLVLLAVCTRLAAQTPAQSWDNIKAATFPVLAPAFANDYDALGPAQALVGGEAQYAAGAHVRRLPVAGLPAGVYACRVEADGHTAVIKIVLQ